MPGKIPFGTPFRSRRKSRGISRRTFLVERVFFCSWFAFRYTPCVRKICSRFEQTLTPVGKEKKREKEEHEVSKKRVIIGDRILKRGQKFEKFSSKALTNCVLLYLRRQEEADENNQIRLRKWRNRLIDIDTLGDDSNGNDPSRRRKVSFLRSRVKTFPPPRPSTLLFYFILLLLFFFFFFFLLFALLDS